jgi:hypothetical protein
MAHSTNTALSLSSFLLLLSCLCRVPCAVRTVGSDVGDGSWPYAGRTLDGPIGKEEQPTDDSGEQIHSDKAAQDRTEKTKKESRAINRMRWSKEMSFSVVLLANVVQGNARRDQQGLSRTLLLRVDMSTSRNFGIYF